MIEDAARDALSNFNSSLLGSVLVFTVFASGLGFRYLINTIKDLKEELRNEREDHKKTRLAQTEDLRNMVTLGKSMESLRDAMIRRMPAE